MRLSYIISGALLFTLHVTGIAAADPADPSSSTMPATTMASSAPSTGPTTKPTKRIDVFLKLKFARTQQSVLQALSARPDSKQPGDKSSGDKPPQAKADAGSVEAKAFQAHVIAGRWDEVAKVVASFESADAKKLYNHVVKDLATPSSGNGGEGGSSPSGDQGRRGGGEGGPAGGGGGGGTFMLPQDVLGLIAAAPTDLEDEQIEPLAQLLSRALQRADVIEPVVAQLEKGIRGVGGNDEKSRYRAAKLLAAAGRQLEAGQFLPPLKDDLPANDPALLELHARYLIAQAADSKHPESRTKAWEVVQALISHPKATQKDRDAAIARAFELWSRVSKDQEREWFKQSFADRQDQGLSLLASAGATAMQNFSSRELDKRQKGLDQQKKLVDAMLANATEKDDAARRWAPMLNVLAMAWLQEADYTKGRQTQKQMMAMRYRNYGQFYEGQFGGGMNPNEPPPLEAQQVLDSAPSKDWIAMLEPSLAGRIWAAVADMHFKNDEPGNALPVIERLAATDPKLASKLADELLGNLARVWDPDQNQMFNRFGGYYYGPYGMMQQPQGGIPLTRSAQNRNLAELAATLRRLEKLRIEPPDEKAVAAAFANAHSKAEVFRVEEIKDVFGTPDSIARDSLFELLQTMRQRLATTWRSPAIQQQVGTKRTDKETEAEVSRGYELMTTLLEQRLNKEEDWKMLALLGSAQFDWAEFDYGRHVQLATYTQRRDRSFDLFRQAAQKYKAALPNLREERSALVYQQWFNAALGASDLAALTRQSTPSQSQIDQIRQEILSLPGDEAERHMASFGKFLSDAPQSLKPELKPRYLKAGLQIVADHPSAEAARKLVRYYADLLAEVELHAAVDGDPLVGHTHPFGLHVSVRHTQSVGREAGGFNKYLTNQQSRFGGGGYYNPGYGYPGGSGPVNYRDDFEKKIREALADRFDIKSITWYDEKVEARPYGKPGWKETPLAYVLLQPKDGSVDKVPPLSIDLDFMDKQGTVILPVSSQVILVDARPEKAPARPVEKIEITQILDQRDAVNGKLSLDIKATARGLLPELADLLELKTPGFTIEKIDDQGLAVNSMDTAGDRLAPVVERSWIVKLSAAKTAAGAATAASFKFPSPKSDDTKVSYKQYADADVADVDPQVAIKGLPLGASKRWQWLAVAGAVILGVAAAGFFIRRRLRRRVEQVEAPAYTVPQRISPFTVIDLLKRIEHDRALGLSPQHRQQLTREILELQQTFFSPTTNGETPPNLSAIASEWVGYAQRQS